MKFLKYLKYIITIWLTLTLLICVGAIIKYNIDLNGYINKKQLQKPVNKNNSSVSNEAEVYVVGAVHFETDKIKRDDVYHFLDSISPSIILYESDTKTVNRMLKRTDFLNQLMSSFKKEKKVESFVSLRYIKYHPESKVLPFEWEERDVYHSKHKILSKPNEMINDVIGLYEKDLLANHQTAIVEEFSAIDNIYRNIVRQGNMYDINNEVTDSIVSMRQYYLYKKIPEIVIERKELADYKDFVPRHMEYWDIRNSAMTEGIINHIKINPSRKIVVLTGFSHRYYLINELKKYEEEFDFSVK